MAFLRSATHCNQSFAVLRKFSSATTSIRLLAAHRHGQPLKNVSRAELLACQQYYYDLKRELTTNNANATKSSMSTVAASAPAAATASIQNPNNQPSQRDPLDVSFNDPIAAFKSKTTWELIRGYFVYLMCSSEFLVENNMKVMRKSNINHFKLSENTSITVSFVY